MHQPTYNSPIPIFCDSTFSIKFYFAHNWQISFLSLSFVKDGHNTLPCIDFDFPLPFYENALRWAIAYKFYSTLILYFDLAQMSLAVVCKFLNKGCKIIVINL